jgi:hypothetical protein
MDKNVFSLTLSGIYLILLANPKRIICDLEFWLGNMLKMTKNFSCVFTQSGPKAAIATRYTNDCNQNFTDDH